MQTVDLAKPEVIGKSLARVDGREKVSGSAIYTIDMALPRMLHAKIKRSPIPHGRILSIDVQKALAVPGVRAIITAKDVPDMRRSLFKDVPILAIDRVIYVGEPVAAVAAEDLEAAEEAVELIEVQYEELPALLNVEEALSTDPKVIVHPERTKFMSGKPPFELDPSRPNVAAIYRAVQGDAKGAMSKADMVVENKFRTQAAHTFHTESIATLASIAPDGGITVWSSHQAPHALRLEVAEALKVLPSKVRIIVPYVGGGFGNKMAIYGDLIAAFLSRKAKRPVKLVYSREEAMSASSVKYPFTITVKDGVTKDGHLIAREVTSIANSGAYTISPNTPRNAVHASISTYDIPNLNFASIRVFTNQVPSGDFRGFGSDQLAWALESQMDIVAEKLGMSPVDFRVKNLLKDGSVNALGEVMTIKRESDILRRVADAVGWRASEAKGEESWRRVADDGGESGVVGGVWKRGKGLALTNKIAMDPGSTAYVRLRDDGMVEVWSSATEIGQGTYTALTQIVANELKIDPEMVRIVTPDTSFTPFDLGAYSSHTLFSVGNALLIACADLRKRLIHRASTMLNTPADRLTMEGGFIRSSDGAGAQVKFADLFIRGATRYGAVTETGSDYWGMGTWTTPTHHMDPSNWRVQGGRAGAFYSPAAEAAEVAVNAETGQVRVLRFVVVMNVGRAINPALVEGQMEGSVAMGLSCTLAEELCMEGGKILNSDLKDYKLHGSLDATRISCIIDEVPTEDGPLGAKGVAEPAMTGVAAAVGNAIYNAVGVRIKDLPITAEKVFDALMAAGRAQP